MTINYPNLVGLIGADVPLRRKNRREHCGPCPFCGGRDRFIVRTESHRWFCRQCGNHGDAADYLQKRDHITFAEAKRRLGLETAERVPAQAPMQRSRAAGHDDPAWQEGAARLIAESQARLWSPQGQGALAYLRGRGLGEAVIREASLGYRPYPGKIRWGEIDIFLPAGIVIPNISGGHIYGVNVRDLRPNADPKYSLASGSEKVLYRRDAIVTGSTVVMVEGDFDALVLVDRVSGIVPISTGGTSSLSQAQSLANTAKVILAFDSDDAGDRAAQAWQAKLGDKACRLLPTAHDITDMVKAGMDINAWLAQALD